MKAFQAEIVLRTTIWTGYAAYCQVSKQRRFWTVKSLWALSSAAGTGCKTDWLGTLGVSLLLFTWSLSPTLLQDVHGHVADSLPLSQLCPGEPPSQPLLRAVPAYVSLLFALGQHVMNLFLYLLCCTTENLKREAFLVISYFPSHFPDDYSRLMKSNFLSSGHHNICYLENSPSLNLWYFP